MTVYHNKVALRQSFFLSGRTPNMAIPYFLGHKTELFSFKNNPKDLDLSYKTDNPKDLDLSYKTDLDLWDCLGRVILVL